MKWLLGKTNKNFLFINFLPIPSVTFDKLVECTTITNHISIDFLNSLLLNCQIYLLTIMMLYFRGDKSLKLLIAITLVQLQNNLQLILDFNLESFTSKTISIIAMAGIAVIHRPL